MVLPIMGMAAAAVGIGVGAWLIKIIKDRRAVFGSRKERRIEHETGEDELAQRISNVEKEMEERVDEDEELEHEEKIEESDEERDNSPKSDIAAVKAAEADIKVAEDEAKAEEAEVAVEAREVAAIAAVKEELLDVQKYLDSERKLEAEELKEVKDEEDALEELEVLYNKLRNTSDIKIIEERTRKFLNIVGDDFRDLTDKEVRLERKREERRKVVTEALSKSLLVFKVAIGRAKYEIGKLKKFESKERKDFGKEMAEVKKAITIKTAELAKARSKGKDADPRLIENLKTEMALLKKQRRQLSELNSSVKSTYKVMSRSVAKIRASFQRIIKEEKDSEKLLASTKKNAEIDMAVGLEKKREELLKGISGTNPHEFAISLGTSINRYEEFHVALLDEDIQFNNYLDGFLADAADMAKEMQANIHVFKSIRDTEKAVESAVAAATQILTNLAGGGTESRLSEIMKQLEKARQEMNYMDKLDKFMEREAFEAADSIRAGRNGIQNVIQRDNNIRDSIRRMTLDLSKMLARTAATMVNRKIEVDKRLRPEVKRLENDMSVVNAKAAHEMGVYKRAA